MDQDVKTTSAVTFATVNTGHGANELYAMDQDVKTTSAVTFATVNTGHGANELYAMDQDVQTTDEVEFKTMTIPSNTIHIVNGAETGSGYVGNTNAVVNRAISALGVSGGRIVLGAGTYTFSSKCLLIGNLIVEGAGWGTLISENGFGMQGFNLTLKNIQFSITGVKNIIDTDTTTTGVLSISECKFVMAGGAVSIVGMWYIDSVIESAIINDCIFDMSGNTNADSIMVRAVNPTNLQNWSFNGCKFVGYNTSSIFVRGGGDATAPCSYVDCVFSTGVVLSSFQTHFQFLKCAFNEAYIYDNASTSSATYDAVLSECIFNQTTLTYCIKTDPTQTETFYLRMNGCSWNTSVFLDATSASGTTLTLALEVLDCYSDFGLNYTPGGTLAWSASTIVKFPFVASRNASSLTTGVAYNSIFLDTTYGFMRNTNQDPLTNATWERIDGITAAQHAYLTNMDQDVKTTSGVTFASVDTGHGANELYAMDQDVKTTSGVTFATVDTATVNTGHGANELYAMDQDVKTTSGVTFATVTATSSTSSFKKIDISSSGITVDTTSTITAPIVKISGTADATLTLESDRTASTKKTTAISFTNADSTKTHYMGMISGKVTNSLTNSGSLILSATNAYASESTDAQITDLVDVMEIKGSGVDITGTVTVSDQISFTGATGNNELVIPENLTDALSITDGKKTYMYCDTRTSFETLYLPETTVFDQNTYHNAPLHCVNDVLIKTGTQSAPSMYFTGDIKTGIYREGTNVLGITANGTIAATFGPSACYHNRIELNDADSTTTPGLYWENDTNSGIYHIGADNIGLTLNGTKQVDFKTTGTEFTNIVTYPNPHFEIFIGESDQVVRTDITSAISTGNIYAYDETTVIDSKAHPVGDGTSAGIIAGLRTKSFTIPTNFTGTSTTNSTKVICDSSTSKTYHIGATVSLSSGNADDIVYLLAVKRASSGATNYIIPGSVLMVRTKFANQEASVAMHCMTTLTDGNEIELYLACNNGTRSIYISTLNFFGLAMPN
jgi:hypothetical protein